MPKSDTIVRFETFLRYLKGLHPVKHYGMDPDDGAYCIIEEIFTRGNCGNFGGMVQAAFPTAELWLYTGDETLGTHVLIKLEGRLFDVTGDVTAVYRGKTLRRTTLDELAKDGLVDNYGFSCRGPWV